MNRLSAVFSLRPARGAAAFRFRARSAPAIVVGLSVWLVLTCNWMLMGHLGHLVDPPWPTAVLRVVFGVLTGLAVLALLALTAWPRGMKPVWLAVLAVAAVSQHFMLNYGTVMDKGMVHNALQTDWRETRDLMSLWLFVQLALTVGLPAWWLHHQPVRPGRSVLHNVGAAVGLLVVALALLLLGVGAGFGQLAPLVRSNMDLRYMINPVSPVMAVLDVGVRPLLRPAKQLASIARDATLQPESGDEHRPPLLVLVVGETARADRFSLNGYARNTNPELSARGAVAWPHVQSCGTATRESLPCMFSHLGRDEFIRSPVAYDGLLDVLQATGMAVLWVDNQSGCKGVCDRVPHVHTSAERNTALGQSHCDADGECLDGVLVATLDQQLARLPPERVRKGVVLVLHQMGSHGPAYYRRSDAARKDFLPECASNALSTCTQAERDNVYDNSIRYTDHVLAGVIDWLKAQPRFAGGMLYVSDHGESLGENGMYLHGMPWSMAPEAQKQVPWILWDGGLARRTSVDWACAVQSRQKPLTHDHYFHTVLGLLGAQSPTYTPQLDMLDACRQTHPLSPMDARAVPPATPLPPAPLAPRQAAAASQRPLGRAAG